MFLTSGSEVILLTFEAAQSIQPSAHGSTLIRTSPSTRVGLFSWEGKHMSMSDSKQESTAKNRVLFTYLVPLCSL